MNRARSGRGGFQLREGLTLREAFAEASSFLREKGVEEADENTRLLLKEILGMTGAQYVMALREPFPVLSRERWENAITRKGDGEPAQYILGDQEFYGFTFEVTPEVLIPRPETELLVEAVLTRAERLWPDGRASVLDVGTGSGAIAVSLKLLRPELEVTASDISPGALAVAQRNAQRLGADAAFREGSLLEPFAGQSFDILVSNPPYIPAADIEELQPEVRDFEPRGALDGGPDGLWPYREMMKQLDLLSGDPRLIAFELGMGQADEVADMLRKRGSWSTVETVYDLAGIGRHVIGIA
ncbi:peptide chain release factor N(5)-glutamine methyltransferase [Saccharibacillus sp. CPCC 101409]|uniref:peptide chain release factor N(5)-glutamine methyltransferase n=1 Tax=Saccharibacillus sp. CPCC 101409 TaxID=3058041 RepID=UPI0026710C3F|nr:peptide chain release factor N(5)-glutamine methyltransferase [Saccharibacillus sp. CPCC 101409]MDO3412132.1 peptide chain release factor N(5)-glutamine methyltransferase [Saccharibacillus sp. CPCC 101409]